MHTHTNKHKHILSHKLRFLWASSCVCLFVCLFELKSDSCSSFSASSLASTESCSMYASVIPHGGFRGEIWNLFPSERAHSSASSRLRCCWKEYLLLGPLRSFYKEAPVLIVALHICTSDSSREVNGCREADTGRQNLRHWSPHCCLCCVWTRECSCVCLWVHCICICLHVLVCKFACVK